ncbi:MAG TPA: BON domain-containing protein [Burkholderiales bacterium]|nr:BON domain-containing protein [Burkholderiales bacterium]
MMKSNSNTFQGVAWIAAAALATALAAGCDRNKPAETAGQKLDHATERAGQKMDQAAAEVKQKTEQAGDKLDDAAITAKVKTALITEPGLKALKIDVDTANGVVTLTGSVDSSQNLERATQVAQAVQGVKSVENRLNVKSNA